MAANIIIPSNSLLYDAFQRMAAQQRMVFFSGLPAVGKSLMLQQLVRMAYDRGRVVHLLQWDVTRVVFEVEEILVRYPAVDGVTHALVRKAVGLWARDAVKQWHDQHPEATHMLIGEVPLIGNRLIELVQKRDDSTESLLTAQQTLFVTPVPSREVKQAIESARERSIAQPQHEREAADAAPNVLRILWQDLYRLAQRLDLIDEPGAEEIPYDPVIYQRVYQHLLQHRQAETLHIDTVLPKGGSVYDLEAVTGELFASPAEVRRIITHIEQTYSPEQLEREVARWYEM